MNFAAAEKIAAAVLYEGYILYPYRATSTKNVQRWNFGTLYPREYAEAQHPAETSQLISECLIEADASAKLDIRVRFLQLSRRRAGTSQEWDAGVERVSRTRRFSADGVTIPADSPSFWVSSNRYSYKS